jgi:hypothetical protein
MAPEGYHWKATSENFNGAVKVNIYYSGLEDKYLIEVEGEQEVIVTKTELELIIHAGGDVLHDEAV